MGFRSVLVAAAVAVSATALATGCSKDPAEAAAEAKLKELSVDQLTTLIDTGKAHIFDANSESTREKYGVIPGAQLLSGASDFDLSKLPDAKDSSLVFYCSSTLCSAAGNAAKRASTAGYTDVNVLPVGIKGWKKAGKATETPKS